MSFFARVLAFFGSVVPASWGLPPLAGTLLGAIFFACLVAGLSAGVKSLWNHTFANFWPDRPPVRLGSAAEGRGDPRKDPRWQTPSNPITGRDRTDRSYYVVHAKGPGGSTIVSIRSEGALDVGIPMSGFRHGGTGNQKAEISKKEGPYTREQATEAVAKMIESGTFRRPPLAAGWVAKVGGQWVTIDDWGDIDFALLQRKITLTEKPFLTGTPPGP